MGTISCLLNHGWLDNYIWTKSRAKTIYPETWEAWSNLFKAWIEQKWVKSVNSLPLIELRHHFTLPVDTGTPGSWALDKDWNIHHPPPPHFFRLTHTCLGKAVMLYIAKPLSQIYLTLLQISQRNCSLYAFVN